VVTKLALCPANQAVAMTAVKKNTHGEDLENGKVA